MLARRGGNQLWKLSGRQAAGAVRQLRETASAAAAAHNQQQQHSSSSSSLWLGRPYSTSSSQAAAAGGRFGLTTNNGLELWRRQHSAAAGRATEAAEAAAFPWQVQLLPRLMQLGLEESAALAVQKAWATGFSSMRFWSHPSEAESLRHKQPSPVRLLAGTRRLLRAHRAAAAAAAAGAETAAAPGAAAPSWGQLDVQRLIARDPGLLLVPPPQLAARLDAMLQGIASIASPQAAITYAEYHHKLSLLLRDPSRASRRLGEILHAYREVIGAEPHPRLLTNSSCSYMRNKPATFKAKLQQLVDRFGTSVVHSMISQQPNLLSSSPERLLANGQVLQQLLSLSDADMQRIFSKAPRSISANPERLRTNLSQVQAQLLGVGLSLQQVSALLLRFPLAMLLNPVHVAAKLEGLKELLGPCAHRLPYFLRQQPSSLTGSRGLMESKMLLLQQLLDCEREEVCRIVSKNPTMLSLSAATLRARVKECKQMFDVTPESFVNLLKSDPQLISLSSLESKVAYIAEHMGWQQQELVAQLVRSNMRVLLYDPALVVSYMQLVSKLVAQSEYWSLGHKMSHALKAAIAVKQQRAATAAAAAAGDGVSHGRRHQQQEQQQQQQLDGAPRSEQQLQLGVSGSTASAQEQLLAAGSHSSRLPCWQVYFARNVSGRLLLRLEYLLATGRQNEVALSLANKTPAAAWHAQFPDYSKWAQLRLQHLAADPGDWPPASVKTATLAAAEEAAALAAASRSKGAPAAGKPVRRRAKHSETISSNSSIVPQQATAAAEADSTTISRRRRATGAKKSGAAGMSLSAPGAGFLASGIASPPPPPPQQQQQDPLDLWSAAGMPGGISLAGHATSSRSSVQPLHAMQYRAASSSLPWALAAGAAAQQSAVGAAALGAVTVPGFGGSKMLFSAAVQHELHLLQQQESAAAALKAATDWQTALDAGQSGALLQQVVRCAILGPQEQQQGGWLEQLVLGRDAASASLRSHSSSSSSSSSGTVVPRPLWCATAGFQQAVVELQRWAVTAWDSCSSRGDSSVMDGGQVGSNCNASVVLSLSDLIRQRSRQLSQKLVATAAASKQWQQQVDAQTATLLGAVMA